jgi:hypothetical protein
LKLLHLRCDNVTWNLVISLASHLAISELHASTHQEPARRLIGQLCMLDQVDQQHSSDGTDRRSLTSTATTTTASTGTVPGSTVLVLVLY